MALLAASLLFSCEKPIVPELKLDVKAANFIAEKADAQEINITCNVAWTASCSSSWVTVAPASGEGNGKISISVEDNLEIIPRTAVVKVRAGELVADVNVTQLSFEPSLELRGESKEMPDNKAGTLTIEVISNTDWIVTVEEGCNWITPNPTSGFGNANVVLAVDENPDTAPRQAKVSFSVKNGVLACGIKVKQPGIDPQISVNPTSIPAVSREGADVEISVSANVAWALAIPEDCDWISADTKEGTGDATVKLTVAPNSIQVKGRAAALTFKTSVGDKTATLNVSQEEAAYSRLTDSLALVALFNATGGAANWKEGRAWDLSKPMDEWYNVKLTGGRVSSMNLASGTITADWVIPAEVGNLTEITNFRIIGCKATGAFPEEIYGLTKLESLYLTNNLITWSISPKIAQLSALKDLYIDQNANLTGPLPKEIGQMTKLVNINTSKTGVSGAIPSELSGCTSLKNFMSFESKFTSIPDNLDKWPALEIIMIYGNAGIEGALPESISNCKTIKTIRFDSCNFTGNVPASYANLPEKQGSAATQLWLKDNKLSGVVPAAVQAHPNWQATKLWKYSTNILPQQSGYGLTLE